MQLALCESFDLSGSAIISGPAGERQPLTEENLAETATRTVRVLCFQPLESIFLENMFLSSPSTQGEAHFTQSALRRAEPHHIIQAMEMLPDLLSTVCKLAPEAEDSRKAWQVAGQLIRQAESQSGRALGPLLPRLLQESFRRHPKARGFACPGELRVKGRSGLAGERTIPLAIFSRETIFPFSRLPPTPGGALGVPRPACRRPRQRLAAPPWGPPLPAEPGGPEARRDALAADRGGARGEKK